MQMLEICREREVTAFRRVAAECFSAAIRRSPVGGSASGFRVASRPRCATPGPHSAWEMRPGRLPVPGAGLMPRSDGDEWPDLFRASDGAEPCAYMRASERH